MIFGASKRGNAVVEVILIIAVIFVLAIAIPSFFNIFGEMAPEMEASFNESNATEANALIDDFEAKYPSMMDGAIALVFGAFVCVALISAFFIDSHPIFFIISVLILLICFVSAALLGNAYEELTSDSWYATLPSDFPITYWLVTHLLEISLGIGFLILIALYGKSRAG